MEGFCPLASGSKGNCIYIGTKQTKLLVDAGINCKNLEAHLAALGVGLSEIDAILVTHEHSDHISGLKTLALKHSIPVFANHETAKGIVHVMRECPKFKIFATGETFEFGDFEIHPFSIQHDTLDPVAFTFKTNALKIGVCADLGYATTLVQNHLRDCDYLYLEANHQPSMVHASSRPAFLKQRILGRTGHLSNESCAELLRHVSHSALKHVYLAHLSQECNSPQVAMEVVSGFLDRYGINLDISIAHQHQASHAVKF